MLFTKKQSGFTLLELALVLAILFVLAVFEMPSRQKVTPASLCKTTDSIMQTLKKVIIEGYYVDTAGHFPVSKNSNTIGNDYNLKYLFEAGGWEPFNLLTHIGWNGPYVQGGILLTAENKYSAENLHSSFRNSAYVSDPNLTDDIHPLKNGDMVVLDGWKRPIILQVYCSNMIYNKQTDCEHNNQQWIARLVSAGPGVGLKLNEAAINSPIGQHKRDDDRILYLNIIPSPQDINIPCNKL